MQDRLSREDFVLERFPDDVFHEMEKKEMKEEGIEQGKQNIIKRMLEKNMCKEEIANLLDYDMKEINQIILEINDRNEK